MGQSGSNMAKKTWKMVSPSGWWKGGESESDLNNSAVSRMAVTPFVFTRRGSMYFDEDGDLAHEFYEEVVLNDKNSRRSRRAMRRMRQNLTPQGEVPLPIPRLNVDFPVILCEAPTSCR